MKIKIATLGCKVNQYESEAMLAALIKLGYSHAENGETADIVIVNSCTVTATSDQKVRQTLRRLKRDNPGALAVLTGCMPQAAPESMDSFTDADIIVGTKNRAALPMHIQNYLSTKQRIVDISAYTTEDKFEEMSVAGFHERTRAFLKIEDGCNRFCAFCIIPYARGRVRSKPLPDIITETRTLAENGYREIVLTGINLSCYGQDIGLMLCDAVEAVCAQEGILRVRLSSLEPERMDKEVITRLSAQPKFCPHFHLSLQSGCDATLQRMNRHYTTAQYRQIVKDLRAAFDNPAITTDIMVGFAGETEAEFQSSLDFAGEIGFAKTHVFAYSRRPGTKAYDAPDQLTNKIKEARSREMIALTLEKQQAFFRAQIGRREPVLFEREISEDLYEGYTMNYTPVRVRSAENLQGKVIETNITGAEAGFCSGTLLK